MNSEVIQTIQNSIEKLLKYCQDNNWAGYDPYDALNSRVFPHIPFVQNRVGRLIFTQLLKRSPINFRPLLLVPKSENPKAIALFLMAFSKLEGLGLLKNRDLITLMTQKLINLRSPINSITCNLQLGTRNLELNNSYFCWGYNFDWQSRNYLTPRFAPNIICTTFAGNALLDAYQKLKERSYLEMAISAGNFILKGLNITAGNDGVCFSYTPTDCSQIHNANLLGAAFLARLYSFTDDDDFYNYALSAVRFSVGKQDQDGSWPYGEAPKEKWIDNFHTGYNLCALNKISKYTGCSFSDSIERGFRFYRKHFFVDGNLAKYYHDRTYPIDIHSITQSIITLLELKDLDASNIKQARSLSLWAIENMQNGDGYFYFRKGRFFGNRICYMRWSQAWMLYALTQFTGIKAKEGWRLEAKDRNATKKRNVGVVEGWNNRE
jgi:hypothetical protein